MLRTYCIVVVLLTVNLSSFNFVASEIISATCNLDRYETARGRLKFFQDTNGGSLSIYGFITNVIPGLHGWHVHTLPITNETNPCGSAGGHFSPFNSTHSAPDAESRHVGDLGNFYANRFGIGLINFGDEVASLVGPPELSILNRTIVIHADRDDLGLGGNEGSLASGNAGARVYTKTGDTGQSSLYNGSRVSKTDPIFSALGDVDELNSAIGLCREYSYLQDDSTPLLQQLEFIQSRLLDVGSAVATPMGTSREATLKHVQFDTSATQAIENWIDEMSSQLPQLTQFILPSGGLAAAHLHMARSICRRSERNVLPLVEQNKVESSVTVYLNRLSDYLFVAARYMAMNCGRPEQTYKKSQS